jgi:hypothetical protein
MRYYNVIYYKDIRLLVIYSPSSRERDVLVIEVIIIYYKGYKRRLKP